MAATTREATGTGTRTGIRTRVVLAALAAAAAGAWRVRVALAAYVLRAGRHVAAILELPAGRLAEAREDLAPSPFSIAGGKIETKGI